MTGTRGKALTLVLLAAFAGIAMLAWTQTWVRVDEGPIEATGGIAATGKDAAAAVLPLGLAVLAVVAVLGMAGRVWARIGAVLAALLGAGIAAVAAVRLSDPIGGLIAPTSAATGIGGTQALRDTIVQWPLHLSAWPIVALIAGIGIVLVAIVALATAHTWPQPSRRYDRDAHAGTPAGEGRTASHSPDRHDRVEQWDALSSGDDPT